MDILTNDEITTLERFARAVSDVGVQVHLVFGLKEGEGFDKRSEAFGEALREVTTTSGENMADVAPSLALVYVAVLETAMFPNDFLPTEATIGKCMEGFWENLRKRSGAYVN